MWTWLRGTCGIWRENPIYALISTWNVGVAIWLGVTASTARYPIAQGMLVALLFLLVGLLLHPLDKDQNE